MGSHTITSIPDKQDRHSCCNVGF